MICSEKCENFQYYASYITHAYGERLHHLFLGMGYSACIHNNHQWHVNYSTTVGGDPEDFSNQQ